jgi:PIN domain nuclease of toxin-antitoxin system
MEFLADTVAIIRHLRQHPALGRQAARILDKADAGQHHIYLSAISLMEVLYLAEAKKINLPLNELINYVQSSTNYSIVPMDTDIVQAALGVDDVPEIHDRIIVATAKHLDVPVLSSDGVMTASAHVDVIW